MIQTLLVGTELLLFGYLIYRYGYEKGFQRRKTDEDALAKAYLKYLEKMNQVGIDCFDSSKMDQ